VYGRDRITGIDRIKCVNGAGGFGGTTIFPDLDHPNRAIPMDTTGEWRPTAKLPGGFFVVDPNKAEPLLMVLGGTPGWVYRYSVDLRIVENGVERTESYGNDTKPLRVALDDPSIRNKINGLPSIALGGNPSTRVFDWDFNRKAWVTGV
jgi:hypothetical protein